MPLRRLSPLLLLVALTLVAYAPVFHAGFVWDDDSHISENLTLRSVGGLAAIWTRPGVTMQYYPLTFTLWWVVYQLCGPGPLAYHVLTLLLHVVASLLLWRVLLLLLSEPAAWLGAALFALHPVNVMSVAWATELKNTLAGSLALLACEAYLRFAGIGASARPARARGLYALSLALFLLALLAKTAVCLVPATLFLILWWKKERLRGADLLPLLPMLGVALLTGLVTVYVEHHSGGATGREFDVPLVQRILISGRSFWFYAGKFLFPHPLTFIYERFEIDPRSLVAWLYPAATVGLLSGLFALRRRIGKGPLVATLHYYLATSGLVFVVVTYMTRYTHVSDHWQYFGMTSAAALAGAGLARLRPRVFVPVVAALLVVLGTLSFRQSLEYRDLETLWRATIEKSPRSWMAIANLGSLRMKEQRYRDAIALFDQALAINPGNEETYNNRGNAYRELGEYERTIRDCTRALELDPGMAAAYTNRALAHFALGRGERALEDYTRAIALEPRFAELYASRAVVHHSLRQYEPAIADLTRAIELKPRYTDAYTNRGVAYLAAGKPELAIADQTRALGIAPTRVQYRNRGLAYIRLGRYAEALADLERAIAQDATYVQAYQDRAKCLLRLNLAARADADVRRLRELGAAPDAELEALLSGRR